MGIYVMNVQNYRIYMSTRSRRQQRLAINKELYSFYALYSLRKMDRAWVRDVWVDRLAPKDILHLYFSFVKYYLIYF